MKLNKGQKALIDKLIQQGIEVHFLADPAEGSGGWLGLVFHKGYLDGTACSGGWAYSNLGNLLTRALKLYKYTNQVAHLYILRQNSDTTQWLAELLAGAAENYK